MLILTTRIGESVHIGDEVEVTVLSVRGNQGRVGISAPKKNVSVHREEVCKRIKREREVVALAAAVAHSRAPRR